MYYLFFLSINKITQSNPYILLGPFFQLGTIQIGQSIIYLEEKQLRNVYRKGRKADVTYNAGIFMGISFEHLNILATDKKKSKMTILVTNWINTQMVNPSKVFKYTICRVTGWANSLIRSALWASALRRSSIADNLLQQPRRTHYKMGGAEEGWKRADRNPILFRI